MPIPTPPTDPVPRRPLGQTSLQLSVLGFGASPLGDVFGQTDPAESLAAVRHAIDSGINFFDVSPYYGLTLAETRLGEALAGYRDRVVLATKCGRYAASEFDFSPARITAGLEDSLRRLRTDRVDLLQAHDVEFADADQIVEQTVPAMHRLQQQGKVRYIGITGYSLQNLISIASRVPVDCVLSYCRYNLMVDDMAQTLLPFAQQRCLGVLNASPLHMGILTASGAPAWHPAPQAVRDAGQRVMAWCREHGLDGSEVALKFCLDQPAVTSTLVGIASRAQVDAALRALSMRLDPALLAALREIVAPVHNLLWPSGREENHG